MQEKIPNGECGEIWGDMGRWNEMNVYGMDWLCIYIYDYIYIYMCIIYVYIYIQYIYIYIYIHTYALTFLDSFFKEENLPQLEVIADALREPRRARLEAADLAQCQFGALAFWQSWHVMACHGYTIFSSDLSDLVKSCEKGLLASDSVPMVKVDRMEMQDRTPSTC